jgi:hypothetical protein
MSSVWRRAAARAAERRDGVSESPYKRRLGNRTDSLSKLLQLVLVEAEEVDLLLQRGLCMASMRARAAQQCTPPPVTRAHAPLKDSVCPLAGVGPEEKR